jgi:thioredoxin reductase (NADPH)
VVVVGGANSAGQAAIFLAGKDCCVRLVVRGNDLGATMSDYLVRRLRADPRVDVQENCNVTLLEGDRNLTGVAISHTPSGVTTSFECAALFCFIGATPATEWLSGVVLDEDGFILTDVGLPDGTLGPEWEPLGRRPLPFETSAPNVFAWAMCAADR